MSEEAEIVVAIEPDAAVVIDGKADAGVKKVEAPDPVAELKSQYATLKTQADRDAAALADARRRADSAAADAETARRSEAAARSQVTESQYDTVASGLDAAKTDADAAEAELKSAMEAGDFDKAAKAQRRIASAESKITRLEEAKADLEARKADPTLRREPERPSDPVEAFLQNRTEPTKAWLREHADFITDRKKNAKLTSAHYDAVSNDLTPDTDAYFEHVETFLGLRKAEGDGKVEVAAHTRKRAAPPVAPVQAAGGDQWRRNGSAAVKGRSRCRPRWHACMGRARSCSRPHQG
jgi:hypothetical protein